MKSNLLLFILTLSVSLVFSGCSDSDVDSTQRLINPSLKVHINETVAIEIAPNNIGCVWSSNDMSIASVDHAGIVTGVSEGRTTITISDEVTGFSATCTVDVRPIRQTLVTSNVGLIAGESIEIKVTPNRDNLIWTSENPDVASVSETGVILGVSAGETKIKVENKESGIVGYCQVEVTIREQKLLISDLVMNSGDIVRAFSPNARGVIWELEHPHSINIDEKSGNLEAMIICEKMKVNVRNPYTNLTGSFTITINPIYDFFEGAYENWGADTTGLKAGESREFYFRSNVGQTYYSYVFYPTEMEKKNDMTDIYYRMSRADDKLYAADMMYNYDVRESEHVDSATELTMFKKLFQYYRERYVLKGHLFYKFGEIRAISFLFESLDGKTIVELDTSGATFLNIGELIASHMSPECDHYLSIKDYIIPGMPNPNTKINGSQRTKSLSHSELTAKHRSGDSN